jgi:hypothetical protein
MKSLLIMYVLLCEITIGTFVFRQVNYVEIKKSWRSLGNTAFIQLPNLGGSDQKRSMLEEVILPGATVNIKLWYMNQPVITEFNGYVSRVKATIPFEIECEDEIYWFKRTPVKNTWKTTVSLKQVVQYLVDQVNTKYDKINVMLSENLPFVNFTDGKVLPGSITAASALQQIKENFGLVSYFRWNKQRQGSELFTGLSEQQNFGRVKHSLAWNIIDNDLTFHRADDVRLRIKPVGFTLDSKKVTTKQEVGDPDGELRTVHYFNVTSEAELLKLAQNDLEKYKYSGFEGTITTFLIPFAEPLMTSELNDPVYGNARSGFYQIDSVTTTFGQGGARRIIELGKRLSA